MTSTTDNKAELKKAVALAAADQVPDNAVVGLGSGTTLEFFIRELGARCRAGRLRIVGVPTSLQARLLAAKVGIPVRDPMDVHQIDIDVDGADEVDPAGNVIKGGGAAHVMEKIVAAMAARFIVIVDQSKLVKTLGQTFPVPLEVAAPALALVMDRVTRLGGRPAVRTGSGKIGPVISELGHIIVDAKFDPIQDPTQLDRDLNAIPGLVGHGLFIRMADEALVARPSANGPEIQILTFSK